MTGMLASVSNLDEAKIVLEENVDIIDLKDPAQGALGAVTTKVAQEVVEFVSSQCLVSATIGDLPMQAMLIGQAISAMASTGVDIIKVGVFGDLTDEVIASLKEQAVDGAKGINGKQFYRKLQLWESNFFPRGIGIFGCIFQLAISAT